VPNATEHVNDDLGEHSQPSDTAANPRSVWVHVLIVLGAIVLLITSTNVWVKRQMLDSDTWVRTSEQLLADEEIRSTLSSLLVGELYESVDVGAQLEQRLPDDLSGLAAPIAAGLREPAVGIVDRLLASGAAQEVWSRANRRAHETFMAIVRDETRPGISTADGTVTLELREIVVTLAERLGLPGSTIERLPEDAGSVVLVESERLAEVQDAVTLIEWAGIALFVVIAVLFAAAVFLAAGWRRVAIRHIGLAVVIDSLLLLVVVRLAHDRLLENYVAVPSNRPAVDNAWWIATALLRDMAGTGLLVGGLVILGTVLVGPARPALAFRRRVGPVLLANTAVTWVGVVVVLLVLAAWTPFGIVSTWFGFVLAAAVVIATVIAVRRCWEHDAGQVATPQAQPVDA
jgi:hypothetical protein